MDLRPREVTVDPTKPFGNDLLKRDKLAANLTWIIEQCSSSLVLALDGSWGCGKTTFLRMWEEHLKSRGFKVECYNAWKEDFHDNPFATLFAALAKNLKEKEKKELGEQAAKIMKHLAIRAGSFAGNAIVNRIPGVTLNVEEKVKKFMDRLNPFSKFEFFQECEKSEEARETFKKILEKAISGLSKKKLIVFVDELDRCRPVFAVELLEKIKHFFEIPGIIFVLAINKEQISSSLRAIYGSELNADDYLEKFFDLEIPLAKADSNQTESIVQTHLSLPSFFEDQKNSQNYSFYASRQEDLNTYVPIAISVLLSEHQVSVRECIRYVKLCNFFLKLHDDGNPISNDVYIIYLLIFVVYLRFIRSDNFAASYLRDGGSSVNIKMMHDSLQRSFVKMNERANTNYNLGAVMEAVFVKSYNKKDRENFILTHYSDEKKNRAVNPAVSC